MAAHSGIASGDVWESFESNSTAASSSTPQYPSFDAWLIHFSSGFLAGLTYLCCARICFRFTATAGALHMISLLLRSLPFPAFGYIPLQKTSP